MLTALLLQARCHRPADHAAAGQPARACSSPLSPSSTARPRACRSVSPPGCSPTSARAHPAGRARAAWWRVGLVCGGPPDRAVGARATRSRAGVAAARRQPSPARCSLLTRAPARRAARRRRCATLCPPRSATRCWRWRVVAARARRAAHRGAARRRARRTTDRAGIGRPRMTRRVHRRGDVEPPAQRSSSRSWPRWRSRWSAGSTTCRCSTRTSRCRPPAACTTARIVVPAPRGEIVDAPGRLLVGNTSTQVITVNRESCRRCPTTAPRC